MLKLHTKVHWTKTGRTFNIRYKKHIHAIRNNNSNSRYSNHMLNTGHTHRTIMDTMDNTKTRKNGTHLNLRKILYV
jgi:hypothetical protein